MTHEPAQGAKMIGFAVLCLQLLTAAIARDTGRIAMKTIAEHEISGETFVASEMLDDQKFATLTSHYAMFRTRIGTSMTLVGPNYYGRNCSLPLSAMPVNPIVFNRVSGKHVVLAIYAVNENVASMPLKLLLVNTEDCTIRYAYDGVLPQRQNYIFTSTNSSDERFTLITHGKQHCGERKWCRLHFDPIYRKREALDFDFSLEQLENIESATESFNANLFVVRVDDPKTNLTNVRLYDLSSNRTGRPFVELMRIPTQQSFWTIETAGVLPRPISSGLSFCSRVPKLMISSREELQCVRFRENGSVMFNETIHSPGLELRVQTIPNGIALFSTTGACFLSSWCKTVQVALITVDSDSKKDVVQIQRREYKLKCHFVASTLRVRLNEATDKIKYLEYLCKDDLHVSSRIIYEL